MSELLSSPQYLTFVESLKRRIAAARISAAKAISREQIELYWEIGEQIATKQEELGWGKGIVETLSKDLRESFPGSSGYSARNLWDMRRLFVEYSDPEILRQVVAELDAPDARVALENLRQRVAEIPWGHNLLILNKIKAPSARLFYLEATARAGWTRAVLLNQIKADAYGRALPDEKSHNFDTALTSHLVEQADEALKSSYNLEFLGIGKPILERELEARLLDHLRDFILELGYGFCFIGSQQRLVLGAKEYFVDLLFYHRFLKSLVAIDLKIGEFEPEFAGKMDFYLNLLNEHERAPDDNPSIGIILCAEKDNLEVEFSLKTKGNPIGVAEYQLTPTLPSELKGKLPTSKQLSEVLRSELERGADE
jgi:predicted nuclease of restriction endonuclease-like (RecB) superfamily